MGRSAFEASLAKRANVERMEKEGKIADSDAVRLDLFDRVMKGIITPEQMRAELDAIKKAGKKNGLLTKQQAYARG